MLMLQKPKLTIIHHQLGRLIGWIDKIELALTFTCMIAIVGMGAAEIFARYVLNRSLFFVYEVTILLANWMYFLGFCLVFKRNRDIEIEFCVRRMSVSARKILSLITNGAILYFLMILFYQTLKLLFIQAKYSTEGLGIPNHYFSLPVFVGTLSILIVEIRKILAVYLGIEEV